MGGDEKNVSAKLDVITDTGTWTDFPLPGFCLFHCQGFTSPLPRVHFFIVKISLFFYCQDFTFSLLGFHLFIAKIALLHCHGFTFYIARISLFHCQDFTFFFCQDFTLYIAKISLFSLPRFPFPPLQSRFTQYLILSIWVSKIILGS